MRFDTDVRGRDVWVDAYVVQLGPQLPWGMPHRIEPGHWTTVYPSVRVAVLGDGRRIAPANVSAAWAEGERVCVSCRNTRVERLAADEARQAAERERASAEQAAEQRRRLSEARLEAAQPQAPTRAPERRTPRTSAGFLASFLVVATVGGLLVGYVPIAIAGWLPDSVGLSTGPWWYGATPYWRLVVVVGAICGALGILSEVILDTLLNRRAAARFLADYERWRGEHADWRRRLSELRDENERLRVGAPLTSAASRGGPIEPTAESPPSRVRKSPFGRLCAALALPCIAVAIGSAIIGNRVTDLRWQPTAGAGYQVALPRTPGWSAGRSRTWPGRTSDALPDPRDRL